MYLLHPQASERNWLRNFRCIKLHLYEGYCTTSVVIQQAEYFQLVLEGSAGNFQLRRCQ